MAYTNVLQPVVINVQRTATFSVENYLRRMCIVSYGWTSLAVGEGVEVGSNYVASDYGISNSELILKLNSFFSFAGNKSVYLLEVGGESIESAVNTLQSFLNEEEVRVFNVVLPDFWFDGGGDSSLSISYNTESIGSTNASGDYEFNADLLGISVNQTGTVALTASIKEAPIALTSSDSTALANATAADFSFTQGADGEFSISIKQAYFTKWQAQPDVKLSFSVEYLASGGTTTDDSVGTATFTLVEPTKTPNTTKGSLNYTLKAEVNQSLVDMLTIWESIDKQQLFFMKYPYDLDPSLSTSFEKFRGMRALHLVAQNVYNDTYHGAAAVVGKTASSIFDIGDSTPASPLNYKEMGAITPLGYTKTQKNALIQAPISFFDSLASNVVLLSGRQLDGMSWDYYYLWYLVHYYLDSRISVLLLNGVNNPNSAIRYNQDGFDTIKSNIIARLNILQGWGVITAFAQSYDATSGEYSGLGDITMSSYQSYIAEHPEDYKNEIIGGISFFVQIGKFPRQVQMNVTLGS